MGRKYPKYLEKGMEFGRLTVIGVDESSKIDKNGNRVNPSIWKYFCKCSCVEGGIVSVLRMSLVRLRTRSCGCLKKEQTRVNGKNNKKMNPIEDCGDYTKIFFFNEDYGYTVIDKEDYDKVKDFCWNANSNGYAQTVIRENGIRKYIALHRLLMGFPEKKVVDHRDGCVSNNRKDNLRIATISQNNMNTEMYSNNKSGTKGIYWNKRNKNWRAKINLNGKMYEVGSFKNKEDAIQARKKAEESYHGEFSYDNSRGGKT